MIIPNNNNAITIVIYKGKNTVIHPNINKILTNTFVCLAQSDSGTDSYPVTVDAEGNETEITQSQGAVWFKIISEANSAESTESTENTETV